ncbi:AFG2-interacting ribosome maturation factor isoform 1-T1 [Lycaon pictus]
MAQDQPLLAVREALRGCFPAVQEQQRRWRGALGDCRPLLAALGSLAEQLQAAQVARLDDAPPLRAFPGLRERLRRKQLEAGDDVLDKLGETLATLLKVRDVVSRHVEQVFEVYEQHADAIGIDAVQRASAVSPSVADMLEWLQDIERHYRNAYPLRICFRQRPELPQEVFFISVFTRAYDYRVQSLTSRKLPEEKVPSVLDPVGRLGKHPSFAQGLGPNFRR